MLKIKLILVGKTKTAFLEAAEQEYLKRLSAYADLSLQILKQQTGLDSAGLTKEKESQLILAAIPERSFVIALDETGKQFSSPEFAQKINGLQTSGHSQLCFIIGGAYGLTDQIRKRADLLLSFSRFTFTHEMIRSLLLEQLYRAFTIIQNKTYHY